jgi:cytochrome c551/c552
MLVGTIWMLAADHRREWRATELANRNKEAWTAAAMLNQESALSHSKLEKLQVELAAAEAAHVDPVLVEQFKARVAAEDERLAQAGTKESPADFAELDAAANELKDTPEGNPEAASARTQLMDAMAVFTREARRREDALTTRRKFEAAQQTAVVSSRGIAIGEKAPPEEITKIEDHITELANQIAELDVAVAAAKSYRQDLEAIVKDITAQEDDLAKQLDAIRTSLKRLEENVANTSGGIGESVNRWPVLDALYNGNIRLDQIWLPDIKINYNFSSVPRYDRCINCHRSIDATAPGSATEPAYPALPRSERVRQIALATPDSAELTLAKLYGFALMPPQGADDAEAKVGIVEKLGPADEAGLKTGDVILEIEGEAFESAMDVDSYLREPSHWGMALRSKVRRDSNGQFLSLETPSIESIYGFSLAPHGQIDYYAVTIETVLPESLAAKAGLEMGDVIEEINGGEVYTKADVESYLLAPEWGQPIELTIRRGLPQPYTSHPRLDLFVGGTSPHPKGDFGCTICHDGQGSATDFKWASHTPNDPDQAIEWTHQYEWFDNHHWIFPMTPERFVESNCLKCHHEVVELEPSERFPDPPAPKLVAGYELVREYGCYGCHEINGFDGPNQRIGPDLRVEPNYHDVAAQVLTDPGLTDDQRGWATTLVHAPDNNDVRHELFRSIKEDASAKEVKLKPETHALADGLKDVDAPGQLRKVGPSLRHLDSKVDYAWLYSWIRKPADFRPTSRMPQFFGHYQHLEKEAKDFTITGPDGNPVQVTDQEYTSRFEDIEIRALTQFLIANSQPFEYLDPPADITEPPSAERGKWLFQSRGCLACHTHKDFPDIHSTQGPDLSRVAAKFNTGKGQRWLYSWLRQPNRYHTRTVMPNVFLEPIAETDATGKPTGQVSDPAADVAMFLLSVPADWQPTAAPAGPELTAVEERALADLTAVWLSASFPKRLAASYAREGIPDRLAASVKVDERGLLEQNMTPANRTKQQLDYVARRSLSRYGCFGCHDIPGYENTKPTGTPLANWGRKDVSQLAFENIGVFLETHGIEQDGSDAPKAEQHPGGHVHGLDPLDYDPDTGYFLQALNAHQRQGFLWQKLRMPRSFDYAATKVKRYDERLRMPLFPFNAREREQVMTFVLGLTSEPPAEQYIYSPGPRENAIVQGRHVLDKYNCKGCHVLDMERWKLAFEPGLFEEPPEVTDFPFVDPQATPDEIAASLTPDRRGLLRADIHGMTTRNEETGAPNRVDIDGVPIEPDDTESEPYYEFSLYEPAVVEGAMRLVGVQNLLIPAKSDGSSGPAQGVAYPSVGGDLAKYLFPHVIAHEHETNPAAKGSEAWGWLPPPLHDEGNKVQTDWLHDFLMDPTPIRPAVVLRMPNFHMSSAEASALVNYFAAKSGAEFPYEYNQRRREDYLAQLEQTHPGLLGDAMKIVTDGNYCVKCHAIGDYQPTGAVPTLGPQLGDVYRRLRPEYVRRWVGNPVRILPYTGMPVNIPYDPHAPNLGGVNQALFPGTSVSQLDGLVDLLMNFDEYAERQTSVRSLVKEPPTATTSPAGALLPAGNAPARR